jgi:hypothetical protein
LEAQQKVAALEWRLSDEEVRKIESVSLERKGYVAVAAGLNRK